MLWFFVKHQSTLHYEIRRHSDGDDYELVITHPDGRQERSDRLQNSLIKAGWQPPPVRLRRPYAAHFAAGG